MDDPEELNDLFDDDLDNMVENKENEDEENRDVNVNLANDEENDNTQTAKAVEIKKRVVRQPRVTLNAERLCGKRGIATLPKAFENIKFKGKGHEKENLDKLMSNLKHWSYRLFPSMCFDDVLQNIERLGTKRPVQVCLRKIRLDMPVLNEDFVNDDDDNDDDESGVNQESNHTNSLNVPGTSGNVLNEDAFDELLRESGQYVELPLMHESENTEFSNSALNEFPVKSPDTSFNRPIPSLTEEQKERIERNARLARERRMLLKSVNCDAYIQEEKDDFESIPNFTDLNSHKERDNFESIPNLTDLNSHKERDNFESIPNLTDLNSHKESDNFESIPNLTDLNNHVDTQSISYEKESNFRSQAATDIAPSDKELEFYNHDNIDSEIASCMKKPHLTEHNESELMFSSEDSNDDIKLNIMCDGLLGNNEQD